MAPSQNSQKTRRSFLAGITSVASFGTGIIVQFLVVPFIVSSVGTAAYGLWVICQQWLGQGKAAEGRSVQALKFTLANKHGSSDGSAKRKDVGSAVQVWVLFSPLLLVAGMVLIWKGPSLIGGVDAGMLFVTRLTIALLVLNLILSSLGKLPRAILVGENLEYKAIGMEIMTRVMANGVLMVLAISLGLGIVGLAGATVLTTLLSGFLLFFIGRRHVPWFGLEWPSSDHRRSFFNLSVWVLSWTVVSTLLRHTDVIILGYVTSPEVVTVYALTLFLMKPGIQVAARITQVATPGLGGVIGVADFALARRVRAEVMAANWIFVTVLGCLMIAWNKSFVLNWMGPEIYAGDIVNLLMVIMIAQQIIYRSDGFIIDATLSLRKKVLIGALAALASNGMGFMLALQYGITGLLLGLIGGRTILTIAFPILVATALDIRPQEQFVGVMRPLSAMSAIWGIAWLSSDWLFVDGWIGLIAGSLFTAFATCAVAVFSGLNSVQRQWLLLRFSKLRLIRIPI